MFENLSVKIVDEICPFDSTYRPEITPHSAKVAGILTKSELDTKVRFLAPPEFHELIQASHVRQDTLILDVRNYYESQLGNFKGSICPPIRKFSSLPQILQSLTNSRFGHKDKVITYCTGGIRCEKAARMISERCGKEVSVLEGGIHNYLEWAKANNVESLFVGSNYVFDARRIETGSAATVCSCRRCGMACYDYTKCTIPNCHLIVPCCDECRNTRITCCTDCVGDSSCTCEALRRRKLLDLSLI